MPIPMPRSAFVPVCVLAALAGSACPVFAQGSSLTPLQPAEPDVPIIFSASFAAEVSADGAWVVGTSSGAPSFSYATIWDATGAVNTSLGFSPIHESTGVAITSDGTRAFATRRTFVGPTFVDRPVYFNRGGTTVTPFAAALGNQVYVRDISRDGTRALLFQDDFSLPRRTVRWDVTADGFTPSSDTLPTPLEGRKFDGVASRAVGVDFQTPGPGWRARFFPPIVPTLPLVESMCDLVGSAACVPEPFPVGPTIPEPYGISSDGETVVGSVFVGSGYGGGFTLPFRWNATDGFETLGDLSGCGYGGGRALDASEDGSVVVGGLSCNGSAGAFVWTRATGLRFVADELAARGVDVSAWLLGEATAVSQDGAVIVGTGFFQGQQRGWRAVIAGPPINICDSIDFNNDGIENDPTDIEAFLSVYSGGPCIPPENTCNDIDFNNDGIENDPTDIEAFLSVYSGGPCL